MKIKIKYNVIWGGQEKGPRSYWDSFLSRKAAFGFLENADVVKRKYFRNETIHCDEFEITETAKGTETKTYTKAQYLSSFCRRCGRTLTDPVSVARGIGPECIKKAGIKSAAGSIQTPVKKSVDLSQFIKTGYDDNRIQPLSHEAAEYVIGKINNKMCLCGHEFPMTFQTYNHDGGIKVPGYDLLQWVYTECPKCGYQMFVYHMFNKID